MSELLKHSERLGVQKLDKIADMLYWNQNKIDSKEKFIIFFEKRGMGKTKFHEAKLFNYKVRDRLINMWNEQLLKMIIK